jgi:PilS N terminal
MRDFILFSVVTVLSILGVAAAVTYIGQGRDSQNSNSATTDLLTLVQNVQGVYGINQSFSGIQNSNVISGGMAPVAIVSGSNLVNEFNGAITVASASPNTTFTVTEDGIPNSVCAKFATSSPNSLKSLTVNGTQMLPPISPSTVATNCQAGVNQIIFEFGH